jgi:hypothetical protein
MAAQMKKGREKLSDAVDAATLDRTLEWDPTVFVTRDWVRACGEQQFDYVDASSRRRTVQWRLSTEIEVRHRAGDPAVGCRRMKILLEASGGHVVAFCCDVERTEAIESRRRPRPPHRPVKIFHAFEIEI